MESAMIASARPLALAAKARSCIEREIGKGCNPALSPYPVTLEPAFIPSADWPAIPPGQKISDAIPEDPPVPEDTSRFGIWISAEHRFDWTRSELFLKQIAGVQSRIGLEVAGNQSKVALTFSCRRADAPIVTSAFQGQFERCALSVEKEGSLSSFSPPQWHSAAFADFYPSPPYSHLLTRPDELRVTPYETLIAAIAAIPPPAFGFLQVMFQPVAPPHDWGRNIQTLLNLEYSLQLRSGNQYAPQHPQQEPSHALVQMARETECKAHNDKPFFAATLRLGAVGAGEDGEKILSTLIPFTGPFLHGGKRLQCVTHKAYSDILMPRQIGQMFSRGLTHRPGFLVNSSELSGLVHIPPVSIFERRLIPAKKLETLPVKSEEIMVGCRIGTADFAGALQPVCIPDSLRSRSAHYIGRPGTGKSTVLEHNVIHDILRGRGLAILDPHGDLVEKLLRLIPEDHIWRTIYFNPADPEYVPLWNPLHSLGAKDKGRTADDLVGSIRSVVEGWGDRLENLLRYAFLAALCLPDSTLRDVADLLRRDSKDGEALRKRIVKVVDNESVRRFWNEDFKTYHKTDLTPPQHKLSKLLASGAYAEMLSQPQSRIDFRRIMDEGLILLIDLSHLGSDVRDILGCFILSTLHRAALGRSAVPIEKRRPFHIYCDEAHRFATGALEDILTETRKYGVGLTLAHQYMSQFKIGQKDALGSVGATVIFNVDTRDAGYLRKDLQNKVKVNDLISLEVGEAIARIGTEIVRLKTLGPIEIPWGHFRDRIIEESRTKYYRPLSEIRAARCKRRPAIPRSPFADILPPEVHYDEF